MLENGALFTKPVEDYLGQKIIEVAAGIKRKEFHAKTGKHCDWCDYKNLACPAWEQK